MKKCTLLLGIACLALVAVTARADGEAASPADVKAMIRNLGSGDEGVRFKAAKALGKLGTRANAALPALTRLALNDPDEDVRRVAKSAAASIRRKAVGTKEHSIVGAWSGTFNPAGKFAPLVGGGFLARVRTTYKADGTFRTILNLADTVVVSKGTYTYEEGVLTATTTDVGGFPGGGIPEQATITWTNKDQITYKGGGQNILLRRE